MSASNMDPHAWATAIIDVIKGGGWAVIALAALFIICRWPPWRSRGKES